MFFPGLTSRPWWDPSQFDWLREITSSRETIRNEMEAMRAALPQDYSLKQSEHSLHKGSWAWHSLVTKGQMLPQAGLLAPVTTALLMNSPLALGVPFSYAFFSQMEPGTEIAPHFGPSNLRLRVHVPLNIPMDMDTTGEPTCGIRVAGETRQWESDGTPLVFDDAYEHATWNRTSSRRDILLFDVWHPELSRSEIEAVQGMWAEARRSGLVK